MFPTSVGQRGEGTSPYGPTGPSWAAHPSRLHGIQETSPDGPPGCFASFLQLHSFSLLPSENRPHSLLFLLPIRSGFPSSWNAALPRAPSPDPPPPICWDSESPDDAHSPLAWPVPGSRMHACQGGPTPFFKRDPRDWTHWLSLHFASVQQVFFLPPHS